MQHTTPDTDEDETLDDERDFHGGDEGEIVACGQSRIFIKTAGAAIEISTESPTVLADLLRLAVEATAKLQGAVQ